MYEQLETEFETLDEFEESIGDLNELFEVSWKIKLKKSN